MRRYCILGFLPFLTVPVSADGMFAGGVARDDMLGGRVAGMTGVASTEQKGIIIQLPEGREALLLQTTYHGPADRFAWVIPVPGQPARDDVFLASPEFIDALLGNTRPEVQTTITEPQSTRMGWAMGKAGVAPGTAPEGAAGEPATVTVHERMEVGDYDVTVLSATGAEVLTDWLRQNRYLVPDDSDRILSHYVESQWYFVAVKMQPGKIEQRPVLEDVAPIGIRFDAERLVYPLYISRASSREKTALLLLVLSDQPVRCDQLAEASLPLGRRFRKGTCYAAIRRQVVSRGKPAAVCEFRGPAGMPYTDLHYEKDLWGGREGAEWSAGYLWTTRLWTLLNLDQLEDLTFSPSPDSQTLKLHISRTGEIYHPAVERLTTTSRGLMWLFTGAGALIFLLAAWATGQGLRPLGGPTAVVIVALVLTGLLTVFGPLAAVLTLVGGLLWLLLSVPLRHFAPQAAAAKLAPRDALRGALVAAGAGGFGYVAHMIVLTPRFLLTDALGHQIMELWEGNLASLTTLAVIALEFIWILLVVDLVGRGLRGTWPKAAWLALPWAILAALIALPVAHETVGAGIPDALRPESGAFPPAQAALAVIGLALAPMTLGALVLVVAYALIGACISSSARPTAQPLAYTLLGLVFVSTALWFVPAAMPRAHAGSPGYLRTGTRELDAALRSLDDMLMEFRARHGCYPARLEDMVGRATPTHGVDSSGNPVKIGPAASEPQPPLEGPPGSGAVLAALPSDPLTGRNDTWVYEPTGSPMIDSGGYEIRIEAREIGGASISVSRPPPGHGPARGPTGRLYWHSDRGVALPFVQSDTRVFAPHALYWGRVISGRVRDWEGHRIVLANVRAHAARLGDDRPHVDAFAWGPYGRRFAYAVNGEHTTRIWTNILFGGAEENRSLVNQPWPVEVYDLDWHPTEEQWLVVARELTGGVEARVYSLTLGSVPRPITEPGNYMAARFTPDGTGILAVATEAPQGPDVRLAAAPAQLHLPGSPYHSSRADGPVTGTLWRLSADGSEQKRLADNVVFRLLTARASGALAVEEGPETDSRLLLFDRAGASRAIDLPTPRAVVADVWLGERELAVATMERQPGVPVAYEDTGGVWAYSLASGEWRPIARWPVSSGAQQHHLASVIVGRDASTGAYVLLSRHYGRFSVCAVRDQQPRLELLASPDLVDPHKPLEVDVAGQRRKVVIEGIYDPAAFQVGDLIAVGPGQRTPEKALLVTDRHSDRIQVGPWSIEFFPYGVPSLDDPETHCYAKLRPL